MLPWFRMSELTRIGVAIDGELLGRFDTLIEKRGYDNRSEAFRDLIRAELVRESSSRPSGQVAGSLTVIYDHHVRLLEEKLTELQHAHTRIIVSVLHVHLDHDNCMEILALRGAAGDVRQFADRLSAVKGVKHAQLVICGTGDTL